MKRFNVRLIAIAMMVSIAAFAVATGTQEGGAEAPTGPVTLTFWHYWDGANGEVLQSLIDEYER
jgi:ABC-type glycerol-3-phosphate transport system substrate-binding protein